MPGSTIKIASQQGGAFASVTGTDGDPQNRSAQVAKLASAGIVVARSNAEAARLAVEAVGG